MVLEQFWPTSPCGIQLLVSPHCLHFHTRCVIVPAFSLTTQRKDEFQVFYWFRSWLLTFETIPPCSRAPWKDFCLWIKASAMVSPKYIFHLVKRPMLEPVTYILTLFEQFCLKEVLSSLYTAMECPPGRLHTRWNRRTGAEITLPTSSRYDCCAAKTRSIAPSQNTD